ncbi:hypothetical protein B5K08_26030 [Rhizobium leguminosarum bv. trifolii]|uniref:Uncharacterized protein n=1 Tax=Rhizobium leguminosarum bv. trifolii TaxID=386 RepID=A0A3E1B4U2_RHILT|nr:hypothetical protein B5K08_26030 [Rhizobium leguminosarum bv. trifolii]RFB85608.1 hypothetical protein B5K10_27020 [Rhizobium leguminosarum bv. trifolii]
MGRQTLFVRDKIPLQRLDEVWHQEGAGTSSLSETENRRRAKALTRTVSVDQRNVTSTSLTCSRCGQQRSVFADPVHGQSKAIGRRLGEERERKPDGSVKPRCGVSCQVPPDKIQQRSIS